MTPLRRRSVLFSVSAYPSSDFKETRRSGTSSELPGRFIRAVYSRAASKIQTRQQGASSFIGNKHLPSNLANDAFIDRAIALSDDAAGDKLQIFRCISSRKVLSPKIVRHTVDMLCRNSEIGQSHSNTLQLLYIYDKSNTRPICRCHGRRSRGDRGDKSPQNLERGDANANANCPPSQILSYRYKNERSVAFKIRQNPFSAGAAGALPRTPLWGSSRRSPRPLSRLERGHPSPYPTPLGTDSPSALANRHASPQKSSQIYANGRCYEFGAPSLLC